MGGGCSAFEKAAIEKITAENSKALDKQEQARLNELNAMNAHETPLLNSGTKYHEAEMNSEYVDYDQSRHEKHKKHSHHKTQPLHGPTSDEKNSNHSHHKIQPPENPTVIQEFQENGSLEIDKVTTVIIY